MKPRYFSALMIAALLVGLAVFAGGAAADDPPTASTAAADASPAMVYCSNRTGWYLYPDEYWMEEGYIGRPGEIDCIELINYSVGSIDVDWGPQAGLKFPGVLSLYDEHGVLLVRRECKENTTCLSYDFPEADGYYLLVVSSATNVGGTGYRYRMTLNVGSALDFNEPDDSMSDATPLKPDEPNIGYMTGCDDVDYYRFQGLSGEQFIMYWTSPDWQILDENANIIAETGTWYYNYITLPADGVYYLRLYDGDVCDSSYEFTLSRRAAREPDDTPATANPIEITEQDIGASGFIDGCGDVDYFSFDGRAGDEIAGRSSYSAVAVLLDGSQRVLDDGIYLNATLPADGTYYLRITSRYPNRCGTSNYWVGLRLVDQPLYMSFDKAGEVQGISFTAGDIMRYWPRRGRWEMFADMSDYGLNGNTTALYMDLWRDYSFHFAMATAYKFPGLGTVLPQDMVDLQMGEPRVEFAFDGSDVGLTTSAERIDSAATSATHDYGNLDAIDISTVGRAVVPSGGGVLRFENEDLARYIFRDYSYETGEIRDVWAPHFDGSAYGLAGVNVIAADADRLENWKNGLFVDYHWFSFDKPVVMGGILFEKGDIAQCTDSAFDHRDPCLVISKFFDASDAGLSGLRVDALEVGRR